MIGMLIRGAIIVAIWLAIIACHFWVCKKRVWLRYDLRCRETTDDPPLPTRGDLLNEQYECGGPLLVLPGLNLVILICCWWSYMSAKCDYNEKYHPDKLFENKVLKR